MKFTSYQKKTLKALVLWSVIAAAAYAIAPRVPRLLRLASGMNLLELIGLLALILAIGEALGLFTQVILAGKRKPPVEGAMVGRIYRLVAVLAVLLGIAYGFGKLGTIGAFFAMFGGMLLGWSLQAPVSGIAAWVLVSLKRPFRPGDRIQFPNLGLVGDVHDTGIMYTMLNQVGGTVGSEEAVGRYILVPNAVLFSQVVINYTIVQESPYMLDEVVVRITYNSNWDKAEEILLKAAEEITGDVIEATGVKPYIRSDLYDYGVNLRLRYQTRVKDRAETAYLLNKKMFNELQKCPEVDLAMPYVYSNRAGAKLVEITTEKGSVKEIPIDEITPSARELDPHDVEQVAQSIALQGLLQPIVVTRNNATGRYDIQAGDLRLAACKQLGWKTITALVQDAKESKPGVPPISPLNPKV
ncbi:MAG: Nucleoid occlusion protein [Candidatus Latescibacteria bacterium ADurb.Bin168]|nr:MAG: Nucleoid occlusion protein [Candidatus Latescibacteria bacterium ADurb.Bin168]